MAFYCFWIWAIILLLNVTKVNSTAPVPVLNLQENIIEGEDTSITCTLPCTNCLDVNLTIRANVTFKSCSPKKGNNPNVTCILDVTQEMHGMEFTCEAQFKTKSPSKKIRIQKNTTAGNRSERTESKLAFTLAMLIATCFLWY